MSSSSDAVRRRRVILMSQWLAKCVRGYMKIFGEVG